MSQARGAERQRGEDQRVVMKRRPDVAVSQSQRGAEEPAAGAGDTGQAGERAER